MLVLPLITVLAAVAHVHATAHDSARNLSHSRRSQSMRQARDARYKARAEAARDLGDIFDPFATPSDSASGPADSSAASTGNNAAASGADNGDADNSASQSISLPGATSTELPDSSASQTPSASGSDSASSPFGTPTDSASSPFGTPSDSASPSAPITDAPSSPASSSAAPTSSPGLGDVLSSVLSGVLDPPTSDSIIFSSTAIFSPSITITDPPPSSAPTSSGPPESSSDTGGISLSIPISVSIPISIPISASDSPGGGPSSSIPVSESITTPPPVSQSQSQSDVQPPPSSIPVSESNPVSGGGPSSSVVEFPGGPSSSIPISASGSEQITASSVPPTTVPVASDLTFILTESSLALASVATTTSLSLENPDAPTTTISFTAAAQTALTQAPLPSGLPSRIYPPAGPITSNPGGNYSFISLLFDGYLGWSFVCTNDISSTQIFAMMPVILATALNTPTETIKTFALQVRVPDSYNGATDADQLQTMFLAYIPNDLVDTLALQLKTRNSAFYTGLPDNQVATALAQHIVSAFALNSVQDPDPNGSNSNGKSANELSSASSQSKTRQDAIIGVVTALGAIAVLVLGFLAYRAFKRRNELAHRRLSDPPDVGIPPAGRDFDQDSIGGQRRRSFYFAEDSLRGFGGGEGSPRQEDVYSPIPGQPGMTQRRNVMPAAISAPILQQSSMNW